MRSDFLSEQGHTPGLVELQGKSNADRNNYNVVTPWMAVCPPRRSERLRSVARFRFPFKAELHHELSSGYKEFYCRDIQGSGVNCVCRFSKKTGSFSFVLVLETNPCFSQDFSVMTQTCYVGTHTTGNIYSSSLHVSAPPPLLCM